MLGFVAGAVGAYVVYRVVRRRHYWRHHRGWGMRAAFERLQTSPAQERVIREVIDSVRTSAEPLRGELRALRESVAKAAQGEAFDASALQEAWARHDKVLAELRTQFTQGLQKIHETLDATQRRTLTELLERGYRLFGGYGHAHGYGYGHGCYRAAHC